MKKNLLLIIIIALSVMNLIFTGIMMFNIMSTNQKTAELVGNIATVLNLELEGVTPDTSETVLSMSDIENYSIDSMTILLKSDEGSSNKYALISVLLYLDMTSEGYKTYGATLNEDVLKSLIIESVGSFTETELRDNTNDVYDAIIENIQKEFDSNFIFKVAFSELKIS